MKNMFAALGILGAAAFAGCASSIKVVHLTPSDSMAKGVPWNLGMTQYTLTITRQLKRCDGLLEGAITVTATPGKVIDEDQRYALSSSGVWATADVTSTLAPDGTSIGLNAHSESQAGSVISSSASLLAGLAPLVAAAAAPAHIECSDAARKALDATAPDANGKTIQDKIAQETKGVAAATVVVAGQTTAFLAAPAGKGNKAALAAATHDLETRQQALDDDQALLAASMQVLTIAETVTWPTSAAEAVTGNPLALSQEAARRWVKWVGLPPGTRWQAVDTSAFDLWLALYHREAGPAAGWRLPAAAPQHGDTDVGVPIRLPRIGRLVACVDARCPDVYPQEWPPMGGQRQAGETARPKGYVVLDGPVLQFGQLYNVPVAGGTFKSEGAVIALDANGLPTSVEIFEKAAAAAVAASAVQDAVKTVAAIPAQLASAALARTQAQVAQANADSALAAAQASAPLAGATAAATAQTAYDNAVTALATAKANASASGALGDLAVQQADASQRAALAAQQSALAQAQANLAVAPALAVMTANTALANASTAQINAQVALAKARQALQQP